MLGLGPSGISFAGSGTAAVKVINPEASADYVAAVERGGPAHDRAFVYDARDLRVLHLTRHLAALSLRRRAYRDHFGSDPLDDFPEEFAALDREGLVTTTDDAIRPTNRGRFYADSIAALLARGRLRGRRLTPAGLALANDNGRGHM
ncbi:MAG: Fe-S oxidoreductase, partial [Thermoleophilia bacterium]|nr:Fe-S oxidoreductase [Thermoleophilia bacterium]